MLMTSRRLRRLVRRTLLFAAIVTTALGAHRLLTPRGGHDGHPKLDRAPSFTLCVAGAGASAGDAERFLRLFPGTPAAWAMTDDFLQQGFSVTAKLPARGHIVIRAPNSTWSAGVQASVDTIHKNLACEYVLLTGGDVTLSVNGAPSALPDAVGLELLELLHANPAAVGFPIVQGQNGTKHVASRVLGGALVLHNSLLDFFLPLNSTSEMLMALQPMYTNDVVLAARVDAIPVPGMEKDGLQERTSTGSLCSALRRIGSEADVDAGDACRRLWQSITMPATAGPPRLQGYTYGDFLKRLLPFFDPLHPSIASHPWLAARYPTSSSLAALRTVHASFSFSLIVLVRDRLLSLRRLLGSLLATDYSPAQGQVHLVFHVDYSPIQRKIRAFLDSLSWPHGTLTAFYRSTQAGIRKALTEAWTPLSDDEFAVLLEDDVEVSPSFMHWAVRAVMKYYYSRTVPLAEVTLAAIALYSPGYSEVHHRSFTPPPSPAYAMQVPCSWGAVFLPRAWRRFQAWFAHHSEEDPVLPYHEASAWSMHKSWKKYHWRFLAEKGLSVVYPNLGSNASFSTNHVEQGTNLLNVASAERARKLLRVPLAPGSWRPRKLPAWEMIPSLDIYEAPIAGGPSSRPPHPNWDALTGYNVLISSRDGNLTELAGSVRYWMGIGGVRNIVARAFGITEGPSLSVCPAKGAVPCDFQRVNSAQDLLRPLGNSLHVFLADASVGIAPRDMDWAFYTHLLWPKVGIGFSSCAAAFRLGPGRHPTLYLAPPVPHPMKGFFPVAAPRAAFVAPQVLGAYWTDKWGPARNAIDVEGGGEDFLLLVVRAALGVGYAGEFRDVLVDGPVEGCTPTAREATVGQGLLSWVTKEVKWVVEQAILFPDPSDPEWHGVPRVPRTVVMPGMR